MSILWQLIQLYQPFRLKKIIVLLHNSFRYKQYSPLAESRLRAQIVILVSNIAYIYNHCAGARVNYSHKGAPCQSHCPHNAQQSESPVKSRRRFDDAPYGTKTKALYLKFVRFKRLNYFSDLQSSLYIYLLDDQRAVAGFALFLPITQLFITLQN